MKKYLSVPLLLTLSLSSTGFAASRPPQSTMEQLAPTVAEVATNVLFGVAEQQVFSEYLANRDWDNKDYYTDNDNDNDNDNHKGKPGKKHKQKSLPPGLRKKLDRGGKLPPGWQKKVARGEVLDEDIYLNHTRSLPEEILRRLPSTPEGTSVKQIDDHIVRVMDATRTVLDVFYLANPL